AMDGVRVLDVETQCTKDLLWNYFKDPKYGGGDISRIYYPLPNNDAVILFKDQSVTLHVLAQKHERFTVVPLQHRVFRLVKVWVDSEISVLVQATDAYSQSLRDEGGLEISTDPTTQEMVLTGRDFQIEWAQKFLSELKDNQIHIARTIQRDRETAAAFEYEKQHDSKAAKMVNGNGADRTLPDPVASSRRPSSRASAELTGHSSSAGDSDRRQEARSIGSPVSEVKSSVTPVPRPRDRVSTQQRPDAHSSDFPPQFGNTQDDAGRDDFSKITSSLLKMTDDIKGHDYDGKGRRQADANDTFNNFASLPNDTSQRPERSSEQARLSDRPDKTHSPRPWKTTPNRSDIEQAERAHLDEYHHNSLGPLHGTSTDYRAHTRFSSLQHQMDHEDMDGEGAGANGGQRLLPPSFLQLSLSHGASPLSSQISPYAMMSNASIELSRRSFKISRHLTLKIYVDDITKARTEAVVNAANWELKNIGGVAGALAKAAGPEMAIECDRLHLRHGPLKTGQVVKTKAYGKLSHLKYVLHTVGPIFVGSRHIDEEKSVYQLAQTFFNCLEFADKLMLKSVTFPFISTGIFGMPMEQCVLAIVTAVLAYSDKKTALEEIHFINNDVDVACEAIIMADQRLKIETVTSAIQRLDEGAHNASNSSSKYRDDDKYSSLPGNSSAGATAFRGAGYRQYDHYLDDEEPQSMPVLSSHARHSRSDSQTQGHRPRAQDDSTLSSQRQAREPSPRPATVGGRPRSSSLDARDKRKVSSAKHSDTGNDSPKGKSKPTFKQALIPSGTAGKKSSTNVASRLSASSSGSKGSHPLKARSKGGRLSDHSGVSDTDSASVAESEDDDGTCPICLEPHRQPKKLPCGHTFCSQCLDRAMATKPKCPKCQRNFGIQTGTQPKNGRMTYRIDHSAHLPGYGIGAIVIEYYIPSGTQEACHPNPGRYYSSCQRTAYLPYNAEGKEVLKMLEKAFANRLIFTIGDSHTTGASGVITWNDIHHKTSMTGGPTNFGYPDADYLRRAHQQGRKGDSLLKAGKLEEAIFCQNRAAEYLLEAMQCTDNKMVLDSLRLQHEHHLNKATRLHMQQMRREQIAAQRSRARTLVSKEVQTDPVMLMATRLGKMTLQPSLVNTQEIHETLRETDTLLDFIQRRRYDPDLDLQVESASTTASEYLTCHEGVKKPKDDKTVIEELVGINEMLRGHILQLMSEKEQQTVFSTWYDSYERENLKTQSQISLVCNTVSSSLLHLQILTREKDDLQRQVRCKQVMADETKLLTNSIMAFDSLSSNLTHNSFFDLPPLEMPQISLPPKLDSDSDDALGDKL
ncbi:hypothetical protein BaRGS_00013807, partial [Batillaria attramentaria]